jgi:hypothetical protein
MLSRTQGATGDAVAVGVAAVVAVVVVTERVPVGSEKGATQHDREEFREMDRKNLTIELKALCREHLAPYEVPSQFEFVKELPRSPLGKLLKRELRKGPVAENAPAEPSPSHASAAAIKAEAPVVTGGHAGPNGRPSNGKPANGKSADGKKSESPEKEVA